MKQQTKIFLTFAALLVMAGCSKQEERVHTVPSSIQLQTPEVDTGKSTVFLHAVYNGDDGAIRDAEFVMKDKEGNSVAVSDCKWSDGRASGTVKELALGKDYTVNFEIHTKGGNTVKAEQDMDFQYYLTDKVVFSSLTALTAKVLFASYNGCDALISKARFIIRNSEGEDCSDRFPDAECVNGGTSLIFEKESWEEDLYTCALELTFFNSQVFRSPDYKLSLLPLPENIILNAPVINEGVFSFSGKYDGEDKTIENAYFELYDKNGAVLETIQADYADRAVSAQSRSYDYGRYAFNCFMELVDGSLLSAPEAVKFTYARPRAFESMVLDPIEIGKAGMVTSSTPGVQKVSYLGYDYEYENVYSRTSSGKTHLYCKSSNVGYFASVDPFQYGIKTVYIHMSSGKDILKFACYGKLNPEDAWEEITNASKERNTFVYDLSGGSYNYFKFSTKGTSELKANSFEIEYYTEAPEEY